MASPSPTSSMEKHGDRDRMARSEAGFTYLGLLILVAILALASSGMLTLGSIVQRRAAEQRLLEVGAAYRQAIASYLDSSPAGDRRYPGTLAELLRDPRYPGVRRHLRQLYADPISGGNEWGLLAAPGGGIMGVHSLSKAQPIKVAEFAAEDAAFEGASSYSEWIFSAAAAPTGLVVVPGQGLAGGTLPLLPAPLPGTAAAPLPTTDPLPGRPAPPPAARP